MSLAQDIVLVRKRTKWERDLIQYGSREAALSIYKHQNDAYTSVFAAHQRQLENLEKIKKALPGIKCIHRKELPEIDPRQFSLLISFGGDNHFVYTAHRAQGIPIIGLNSDPQSSTGALLYFTPEQFIAAVSIYMQKKVDSLDMDPCLMEDWTRVEGELLLPEKNKSKKIKLEACISEISVRSSFHDHISRFLLRKNNENWEEIKCSGLLLVCGAGSSGWYRNAHPEGRHAVFPKEAPFFRALARETQYLHRTKLRQGNPQIYAQERLEIISEMNGEITIDANTEQVYPFPPGARVSFFLSGQKLKVLRKFSPP